MCCCFLCVYVVVFCLFCVCDREREREREREIFNDITSFNGISHHANMQKKIANSILH